MPWAGGTFTRTNGTYSGAAVWQSDAAAAIKIRADRHDTHDQDLAQGINNTLTKDGQNSPNQHISWGGFKITSLGAGAAAGDAVNKGQLDAVDANANTRVLKAGDSMTGQLTMTVADNFGYVVTNGIVITRLGPTSLGGSILLNTTNNPLHIGTNNIIRMTVAANGDISATNPMTLNVPVNSGYIVSDGTHSVRYGTSSLGGAVIVTATASPLIFGTNGAEAGRFDTSGNLTVVGGITPGGGRKISQVQLSTSAPGALADGVLYLQY